MKYQYIFCIFLYIFQLIKYVLISIYSTLFILYSFNYQIILEIILIYIYFQLYLSLCQENIHKVQFVIIDLFYEFLCLNPVFLSCISACVSAAIAHFHRNHQQCTIQLKETLWGVNNSKNYNNKSIPHLHVHAE